MATTELNPSDTVQDTEDDMTGACAVCPHPWAAHDRIAARFCTATIAGKYGRGCVCAGPSGVHKGLVQR
ncbi:RGCVC family protein [Actinokineospora sp.]|uniref:RGCVC family protein n=1 Tax=Actinokineospora sp. TaxID=1872133 RepID=UPI004037E8CF